MHAPAQTKTIKPRSSAKPAAQRATKQEQQPAEALQKQPIYSKGLPQRKVAVGAANDGFEREADSVAQKVASGGSVDAKSLSPVTPGALSRMTPSDKVSAPLPASQKQDEPKPLQKAEMPKREDKTPAAPAPPVTSDVAKPIQTSHAMTDEGKTVQKSEAKNAPGTAGQQAESHTPEASQAAHGQAESDSLAMSRVAEQAIVNKGAGRPLNPATRQTLSERMNVNLDHVRIHDNAAAQEACRALHARAFTHGSDIWLGTGESDSDLTLMAHEVTHVIQQTDHVQRKLIQRGTEKPKAKTGNAAGTPIGKVSEDKVVIPLISLPKFKTEARGEPSMPSPYEHKKVMKVKKRPATGQRRKWIGNLQSGVKATSSAKLTALFGNDAAGSGGGVKFFTTAAKGTKANVKQWKQASESQSNKTSESEVDVVLFGKQSDILKEVVVPYWNKKGKEHNFDIDHVWEIQLGGDDKITNYELLDWEANRASGIAIRNQLTTRYNDVISSHEKDIAAMPKGVRKKIGDLDAFVESGKTVEVTDFDTVEISSGKPDIYWTYNEIEGGKHLENLREMSEKEIGDAGLGGSETNLAIYSSRGGGRPRFIPWEKGNTGLIKLTKPIENFYFGFRLTHVKYGTKDDYLKGELVINTDVFESKKAAKKAGVEVDFDWPLRESPGVTYGGYIDDTQILPKLGANIAKANGMSPLVFDEARLDSERGILVTGSIRPDVSWLAGTSIDFLLAGDEVRIDAMLTAGQIAAPDPLHISGGYLSIFASSKRGFGIDGKLNFGIDNVGSGHIGASATAKKNLADAGIELEGKFDFEEGLFDKADIKASYRKDESGEYGFAFNGSAEITRSGKVGGIKKANVTASYAKGKFSARGDAELTLDAVQKATLALEYDETNGLILSGAATLKSNKLIESGSGTFKIERKSANDYHLMASGKAVPRISGWTMPVDFNIEEDLFLLQGTTAYSKGKLQGSITGGVTNRPVSDGKPAAGKPKAGELRVFGGGTVSVQLSKWLQATAGVKLMPDGSVELLGGLSLPKSLKLFDEKKYSKKPDPLRIDIPIVGVSFARMNVGVFAYVQGGIELFAGIGPGELQDTKITVTYNTKDESSLHAFGEAHIHVPVNAGLRLAVEGGIGVGAAVISARGGIEVAGTLQLAGALHNKLDVDWTPQKGLTIENNLKFDVQPEFLLGVAGKATVDGNAGFGKFTLYEKELKLAGYKWGSGMTFGVEYPLKYEEGKSFELSPDKLKFTKPDINVKDAAQGAVKQITGK